MKKCIVCMVLLCLLLTACATGADTPTTTTPTTRYVPTTCGLPLCYAEEHTYENGVCKYCKAPQQTAVPTSVTPTTNPTTAPTTKPATVPTTTQPATVSTTRKLTVPPTTKKIYADPICYIGHTYVNGICRYCKWRDPNYTGTFPTVPTTAKPTPKPTSQTDIVPSTTRFVSTSTPLGCYHGVHSYENGICKYCNAEMPPDVDARLIVNGKEITEGNYVKINHGFQNTSLPLTAILTELGIDWEWESSTTLRIGSGEHEKRLDLTHSRFGWLAPPGTRGSVRRVVDGEVIIDGNSLWIDFLRAQNISVEKDYDTNTIRIEG